MATDNLRRLILEDHKNSNSWQKTGEHFGINKATARLLSLGREPGNKVRLQLGLPPERYPTVIPLYGVVPPGTQVIAARQCVCSKWFIPNTATRRKCFECNAPRNRK
jgi:hypothetical protein